MSRLALSLVLTSFLSTAAAGHGAQPIANDPPLGPAVSELRIAPPMVSRAQVRAKLLANRRANLARFHAYRIGGVYPSNVFTSTLGNIWRDQQGNYCAAATIIRASGAVELVEQIAEDDNFFRIADVEQGPVMDWILTSGLTQQELVLIQKPFRPVTWQPDFTPTTTIAIDPMLRAAETRRLAKLYRQIERKLVNQQRRSIETAVDRLMKRPDLARQLLAS